MIKLVDHLLVQEKLTRIRREGIDGVHFRAGMIEIGRLIGYQFANTLESQPVTVKTPMGVADGINIKDRSNLVVISVLRAAIPLVEGIMRVFGEASCGVVGAWRSDRPPFQVEMNYTKIPQIDGKIVIIADPMLATGSTMNTILEKIENQGNPKRLVVFNVIATEEGIKTVQENHPEVEIYTCSIESELSPEGYIVPGLGDAGDLAFGKPCD
jgi:uracil phosphoribosyltransferase